MMRRARRRGPKGKAPPKPGTPRLMFFDATRWSWPWRRSAPARAAGCEKAPNQPCCVSCDQNVGAHLVLDLGARVFAARSAFQAIEVYATRAFGRVLLIDGDLQLTARDEAYYHEMMVHVPLARSPRRAGAPARVLVVGGGDGGCAREALRWPGVTVTLVAASCGDDEFREISTGKTKRNRYRHAW